MNKIHTNYNQFNLEQLLMESVKEMKFVISKRLRDILANINSEIAEELLKSHRDLNFKTKQTFIDIAEGKDDSISFILANKAADILNIEESELNTSYNRTLRDRITNNDDVYNKYRGEMKLGRFVNTVFPNKFPAAQRVEGGQKSRDVENFVRLYKSLFDQDTKFLMFDIVKGDDISYWYKYTRYMNREGSLGGSCMSDVSSGFLEIYTSNENVSMVILYENQNKNKIRGRAILWNLSVPEDRIFMDRIYTNDSSDEQLFMDYATSKGWLYKSTQSYGPDGRITDGTTNEASNLTLKCQLKAEHLDEYPYLDTLIYYNPDNGIISNRSNGQKYILQCTNGEYDELDYDDYETVYSQYHNDDIRRRDARWCQIGEDWVYSNEALRVYNTGLEGEIYAVPGNPTVVRTQIRDIIDHYIPKEKAIWSDYLNTWLFYSSVREVYTDKEKINKVLDHKKRLDKNFVQIGDDFFNINIVHKDDNDKWVLD